MSSRNKNILEADLIMILTAFSLSMYFEISACVSFTLYKWLVTISIHTFAYIYIYICMYKQVEFGS